MASGHNSNGASAPFPLSSASFFACFSSPASSYFYPAWWPAPEAIPPAPPNPSATPPGVPYAIWSSWVRERDGWVALEHLKSIVDKRDVDDELLRWWWCVHVFPQLPEAYRAARCEGMRKAREDGKAKALGAVGGKP